MSAMLTATEVTSEHRIMKALESAGFQLRRGWFYPAGDPGRAAVRLSVYEGQYQIWRRRKLNSPWMIIATIDTQDFDETAFQAWRDAWPLTH